MNLDEQLEKTVYTLMIIGVVAGAGLLIFGIAKVFC